MHEDDPTFEALLAHLRDSRGADSTGYERTSLTRRVDRRRPAGHDDLRRVPRPPRGAPRRVHAWEHLRGEALPDLLAGKGEHEPIRVWSAGCASGEEAYTLAMVLAELLGVEEFRRRVKIYATDVDEEALAQARQAVYGERAVRGVDPVLPADRGAGDGQPPVRGRRAGGRHPARRAGRAGVAGYPTGRSPGRIPPECPRSGRRQEGRRR